MPDTGDAAPPAESTATAFRLAALVVLVKLALAAPIGIALAWP